jgi:hypothetical protein
VQRPEQTVESLRATAKALDVRRRQLAAGGRCRGTWLPLATQRATLASRRDATQDTLARGRLEVSLRSLDAQHGALQQLVVAAERVDGEYTSLLVLLQELRTRVAVARGDHHGAPTGRARAERAAPEQRAGSHHRVAAGDDGLALHRGRRGGARPVATPSAPSRVRE